MTVEKLITKLSKFDSNLEIMILDELSGETFKLEDLHSTIIDRMTKSVYENSTNMSKTKKRIITITLIPNE